jgi:3D-(3,5/4)-trihydroxycyclohexane-1,2-dione acylhydrolase (decyclizing)
MGGAPDRARVARAAAIGQHGGLDAALAAGAIAGEVDISLSEALVLGLIRQGVTAFVTVLGHGTTDIAEVLRVYAAAGVLRVYAVRHETEASHAACALRWVTGEKAAVLTSIGPGALHALAGSLVAASDGIGVWHIYGDETSEGEGPNLQGPPGDEQHLYLRLCSTLGGAYVVHTPEAIGPALRRGANRVDHPHRPGPFFLLMPINTQPALLRGFNLRELPRGAPPPLGPAADAGGYDEAAAILARSERVVVRVGRGAACAAAELKDLLELADGVAVVAPAAQGVLPFAHQRNMTVGGSKGSISGNFAMSQADALVVVGSRSVCQSDCSRAGYPLVRQVVNINTDVGAATHYADTVALVGDAAPTLRILNDRLRAARPGPPAGESPWLTAGRAERRRWEEYKAARLASPALYDPVWEREVLTQPAAISAVQRWARERGLVLFVDSGDVQAYAFQLCEDDVYGQTITETGSSYMGFAASALLATAIARQRFYGVALVGDGSFTMSPQILIDGAEHGAAGCIVVLDNRRMGAISSLQRAQYGADFATSSAVAVDFGQWARSVAGVRAFDGGATAGSLREALDKAFAHDGLSLVHVPVYFGDDPAGGLESFGGWNVGPWVAATQRERHRIGL